MRLARSGGESMRFRRSTPRSCTQNPTPRTFWFSATRQVPQPLWGIVAKTTTQADFGERDLPTPRLAHKRGESIRFRRSRPACARATSGADFEVLLYAPYHTLTCGDGTETISSYSSAPFCGLTCGNAEYPHVIAQIRWVAPNPSRTVACRCEPTALRWAGPCRWPVTPLGWRYAPLGR